MTKTPNADVESVKAIFRKLNDTWNTNWGIKVIENSLGCSIANTVTLALISCTADTGLRIVIWRSCGSTSFFVYQEKKGGDGYSSRPYRSLTKVCCLAISIFMEQSISPRGDIETDDCDC
jgi:hypothetical protein